MRPRLRRPLVRLVTDTDCIDAALELSCHPLSQTTYVATRLPKRGVACKRHLSCTYLRVFARVRRCCLPYLKDAARFRFFKSRSNEIGMDVLWHTLLEHDTHRFSNDGGYLSVCRRSASASVARRLLSCGCERRGKLSLKTRSIFLLDLCSALRKVSSCLLPPRLQLRRKCC